MKYNIPDSVLREIISFAKKHYIHKIILFGSRASGKNTLKSDIDIAIYGGDFNAFYWDIKQNIHSLLSFDIIKADDKISNDFANEIKNNGVILYEKVG
ncbi:MAG: nucleotidyltransferase domain-containing protein [Neisseriaceae bacterium]|nr:nucleotidyltransferase domain-containing protein [Neisseriaceae bacterium]MBR5676029.1 nucleotidyltransferase domain-containing protein [Neisseriaceae bacterium]